MKICDRESEREIVRKLMKQTCQRHPKNTPEAFPEKPEMAYKPPSVAYPHEWMCKKQETNINLFETFFVVRCLPL